MNGEMTARPGSMTVAEFIAARLSEEEATARRVEPDRAPVELRAMTMRDGGEPVLVIDSALVLRQVTAMRAILASCIAAGGGWEENYPASHLGTAVLRHLAAIWNDHPEYRQEWKS